jgi:hypothetical protein
VGKDDADELSTGKMVPATAVAIPIRLLAALAIFAFAVRGLPAPADVLKILGEMHRQERRLALNHSTTPNALKR